MEAPLYKKLHAAACTYFNVTDDFFRLKLKDGHTDRRRVLFWLLWNECNMDYGSIARMYGFSRVSMRAGINIIDFKRAVFSHIARDIDAIRKLCN